MLNRTIIVDRTEEWAEAEIDNLLNAIEKTQSDEANPLRVNLAKFVIVSVGVVLEVKLEEKWVKLLEEENGDDSADEEKPQIEEDIEVKRMKRLEQLRLRRPYHAISEDGSGWVSISDAPKPSNNQDFDMSPPRQRRARFDTPSPESELKPSGSGDEAPDLSPPRKHLPVQNSERPESPELSPPRGIHGRSSEFDASRGSFVPDLSPPRKSRMESFSLKEGRKTGLITGQDIKEENAKTKKNDWSRGEKENISNFELEMVEYLKIKTLINVFICSLMKISDLVELVGIFQQLKVRFKEMDPIISGRGADPVYRDKRKGERISKEEFLKSQKGEEKPKEKKLEWGKGLAQKREAEARQHELELEKEKPFARTRDDPELDKMLKERVRWGDPMAHLVKPKHSEPVLEDLGNGVKMKESGFIIPQDIPSHSWIKRRMEAAPNRYGIRPGRHWDGVDRSNGYEKQFFKRMNEKQATDKEAYLWSVSDM
ncbi:hypothetical protein HHK36_006576 [Tetracentron sinense]|uniref:BUD13 homolog n=1 Tax=Tetracentron sinense TaxID=13715 RepID=A0A835DKZ2_TETSI|nr:hypothetical protein HHK36_006576 [Tetracentron sinense]